MSIPSPRGIVSRDSCLQPDTRNSLGTSGHVFEGLPAPSEASSALVENSKNFASASCRSMPSDTGKNPERREVFLKRTSEPVQYRHLVLPGSFRLGLLNVMQKGLIHQSCMMEIQRNQSRNCISITSLTHRASSVGRPIFRLKYALLQVVLQSQCCGSKK